MIGETLRCILYLPRHNLGMRLNSRSGVGMGTEHALTLGVIYMMRSRFSVLCLIPEDLERQASEATNKFFEARVAVMGYKCRNMQLQGELDAKGGHVSMHGSVTEQKPTGLYCKTYKKTGRYG